METKKEIAKDTVIRELRTPKRYPSNLGQQPITRTRAGDKEQSNDQRKKDLKPTANLGQYLPAIPWQPRSNASQDKQLALRERC